MGGTDMAMRPRPPQPEPPSPYLPPGPEALTFDQFNGINTSTSRAGVKNEEMWWCDGFIPIGPRMLRTLYGVGEELWDVTSVFATGVSITLIWFGNISFTPVCIAVCSNGAIVAINTDTGNASLIAAAGTLPSPDSKNTSITQSGSGYFIFVNAGTSNGYFIWDGTTFYEPGDPFLAGAIPTGISGNAVEVYAGRVWVANYPVVQFSAPGSLIDFTTVSGGGSFSSSDSFLRTGFTALRQSNGFLYLVADSSINYISGVQTSGSPLVTTFTNQNADPEVGSAWPWSVTTFGRNILLANPFGVHVSYGAAVTKISEALDGVYGTVPDFGGLLPSSAKAIVFGKKIFCLLLPIIDPVTGQQVNKLMIWNGKIWFASEQDVNLTFIGTQEIDSVLTAWGTDGQKIYPLFQTPTSDFHKTVQSRLWDAPVGIEEFKSVQRLWGACQLFTTEDTDIVVKIDNEHGPILESSYTPEYEAVHPMTWTGLGGLPLTWTGLNGDTLSWLTAGIGLVPFRPTAVSQNGVFIGFTATTTCPDLALVMLKMAPEVVGYRG